VSSLDMRSLNLPDTLRSVLPQDEDMTRGHTTVMLLVLYTYIVLAMSWTGEGPSLSVESEIDSRTVSGHPLRVPIVVELECLGTLVGRIVSSLMT